MIQQMIIHLHRPINTILLGTKNRLWIKIEILISDSDHAGYLS